MAKAACLVLIHPDDPRCIAVCSRRHSKAMGLPGGKMDPGETMLETSVRETAEEIGVHVDPATVMPLFRDVVPGERDFWVETFVAVSPTEQLQQMEKDISVQWVTWVDFLQNENAFKDYNRGVESAFRAWVLAKDWGFNNWEPILGEAVKHLGPVVEAPGF